jgi:hypothetical protein
MMKTSPDQTAAMSSTDEIDALLENYLMLLDMYTNLRTELNQLQSSVSPSILPLPSSSERRGMTLSSFADPNTWLIMNPQVQISIARANFSNSYNMRYGQDRFDERMQASRRVSITPSDLEILESAISFRLNTSSGPSQSSPAIDEKLAELKLSKDDEQKDEAQEKNIPADTPSANSSRPEMPPRDPLRWFGILTPQPLRSAQKSAIALVNAVPRLCTVDTQLKELEIQIRRARKKHVRACQNDEKSKSRKDKEYDAEQQ